MKNKLHTKGQAPNRYLKKIPHDTKGSVPCAMIQLGTVLQNCDGFATHIC